MKLKIYYSDTVEAAIRLAGVELGHDAVFLGSKKNKSDLAQGRYEVSFAVMDGTEPASRPSPRTNAAEQPPGEGQPDTRGGLPGAGAKAAHHRVAQPPAAASAPAGGESPARGEVRRHWREFVPEEMTPARADPDLESRALPSVGVVAPPGPARERNETEPAPSSTAAAPARDPFFEVSPAAPKSRDLSGWDFGDAGANHAFSPSLHSFAGPPSDLLARLAKDIGQLHGWMESRQPPENLRSWPPEEPRTPSQLAGLYSCLVGNEVEAPIAAQLVGSLRADVEQGAGGERLRELLSLRLRTLCRTASGLGQDGAVPRVAALVGPAASGKTTALVKLAIRFGVASRRRVHLLAVDPRRVGSIEQLQAYAGLLDVPLTVVPDAHSLPAAFEKFSQDGVSPDLVLLDTPSYGPAEESSAHALANAMGAIRGIDIHLVLALSAKPADLRRNLDRHRVFQPSKLLFTHVDETSSYGPLLNECARTRLPVSFFSTGQRVPDDLAPATESSVIGLLLNKTLAG